MAMSLFEKATKDRFRFNAPKGEMTVEDVWQLPLQHRSQFDLDTLAKNLNRQIKEQAEESFVTNPSVANTLLKAKFDIVLHIIESKKEDNERARKAKANAERKQKLMAALERKEDEQLEGMSHEEIKAELANL